MKKFIVLGNGNAVTYKEIFPYIKNNQLWLGASKGIGGKFLFKAPDYYEGKYVSVINGVRTAQVNNACWFTNIEHKKRNTPLDLYKRYSNEYKHYDNYDAIDSRTEEIPMDYNGVIGVPITFLDKYCPEQFEIVGMMSGVKDKVFVNGNDGRAKFYVGEKATYARILIQKEKMKKFLIIGSMNAITYKEIFPYLKDNKMWLGVSMNGANRWFYVPNNYEVRENAAGYKVEDGKKMLFVNSVVWYTNINNKKRNTPLDLYKQYSPEKYPKYDNYDAIDCGKVAEIPIDYDGVIGVPITFLDKYCPEQFEIVDARTCAYNDKQKNKSTYLIKDADGSINGKPTYARICIRRKLS